MRLDFSEIQTPDQFENLVYQYFEDLKENNREFPQIRHITIKQPGIGADGGKDILVTFTINDTIATYYKTWLVQCKFYQDSVKPSHLKDDNIPTLIHSYKADGYLLIAKGKISQKLIDLFNRLDKNCKMGYKYDIWNGDFFKSKIQSRPSLIETFFPEYHTYLKKKGLS
jgi:hypothetical protein